MKRSTLLAILASATLAAALGCTVHRSGSQAIEFNPLNWGSDEPAVRPMDGWGYDNGVPLDAR